jgi:colicin import membrane protein
MAVAVQSSWFRDHWPYLFGAVIVHVLVAGLFALGMIEMRRNAPPPTLAIQAMVVDQLQLPKPARQQQRERERREAEARAAAERKQQEEEATKREQEQRAEQERQETVKRQEQEREQERVRQEQLTRERETQERIAKEKAAEEQRAQERRQAEQKKLEAERQAKAEAERKRVAEIERKQREREEAERKQAAADAAAREKQLQDQLAEEEANNQLRSSPAMSQYAAALQQHVERNWNRPPSANSGLECVIAVSQSSNGTVLRVQVEQCNGDAAVKRSIENAVQRASPLPLPSDMRLFERNLRFIFKPAG